jgi:hypothetical protein
MNLAGAVVEGKAILDEVASPRCPGTFSCPRCGGT